MSMNPSVPRPVPLLLLLLLLLHLLAGLAATSTTAPPATALPGARIRCYVCDPCSLGGEVSTAVASNMSVCEQCGKNVVGYLGTVTRIKRECYRREDTTYAQCSQSAGRDTLQVCCSNSDYCNGASRSFGAKGDRLTHIAASFWLLRNLLGAFSWE